MHAPYSQAVADISSSHAAGITVTAACNLINNNTVTRTQRGDRRNCLFYYADHLMSDDSGVGCRRICTVVDAHI